MIGDEYEILILTEENGISVIEIGGVIYREENSGVLSTEKNITKIRLPQSALDEAGEYTVIFYKTIDRKAYFSELAEPVSKKYSFKPLRKDGQIKIYYISDVHYKFANAKAAAEYFGLDTDLYIIAGDIGEVETVTNYEEIAEFSGDVSKGERPVVFVRGNHDTRGKLAELYTDYFPADGKKTYFTFRAGYINGIAFDCGEDKPDSCPEYTYPKPDVYGGVNVFSDFREREDEFFKTLSPCKDGEITLAVGHIPPAYSTSQPGTVFDIEGERYAMWSSELDRVGVDFMISGHFHKVFVLEPGDARSLRPHSYPIIIGSALSGEDFVGTAIVLDRSGMEARFTNMNHEIIGTYTYKFKTEKA